MPAIKTVTLAQAKAAQNAKATEKTPDHIPDSGKKVETPPTDPKIPTEKPNTTGKTTQTLPKIHPYPKSLTPPLKNLSKTENTTLQKTIENTENIQEVEEDKILEEKDKETIQAYFSEEDKDEKEARETKEKIQREKEKTYNEKKKDFPSTTERKRKSYGTGPRPCQRCGTTIQPKDPRTKFCKPCGIQAAKEGSLLPTSGRAPLDEKEVREKLRPFLRIGFNLKEACLEAELWYQTIIEKTREWVGFAEFIERHMNYSILKAKRNIFDINANPESGVKEIGKNSRWLLERRRPEEFGNKVQIAGSLTHIDALSEEKKQILQALIASRLWKRE